MESGYALRYGFVELHLNDAWQLRSAVQIADEVRTPAESDDAPNKGVKEPVVHNQPAHASVHRTTTPPYSVM
jgi:hypothetical protein